MAYHEEDGDPFSEAKCRTDYNWDGVKRPFFELYESEGSDELREQVDAMCLACPVRQECFRMGVVTGSTGVFGGWFLKNGNVAKSKNSHKTTHVWEALRH